VRRWQRQVDLVHIAVGLGRVHCGLGRGLDVVLLHDDVIKRRGLALGRDAVGFASGRVDDGRERRQRWQIVDEREAPRGLGAGVERSELALGLDAVLERSGLALGLDAVLERCGLALGLDAVLERSGLALGLDAGGLASGSVEGRVARQRRLWQPEGERVSLAGIVGAQCYSAAPACRHAAAAEERA